MNKITVIVLIVAAVLTVAVVIILIIGFAFEPRVIAAPWKVLMRLYSLRDPRKPFYSRNEMSKIYPDSLELEKLHPKIKDEFRRIYTDEDKIVLREFGKDVDENMRRYPITSSVIQHNSQVVGCYFRIFKPHEKIVSPPRYSAGVLRYHLGVSVPRSQQTGCFMRLGEEIYSWKEGESVMFGDLFEPEMENNTDDTRVFLFIDILKPLPQILTFLNSKMLGFVRNSKNT